MISFKKAIKFIHKLGSCYNINMTSLVLINQTILCILNNVCKSCLLSIFFHYFTFENIVYLGLD